MPALAGAMAQIMGLDGTLCRRRDAMPPMLGAVTLFTYKWFRPNPAANGHPKHTLFLAFTRAGYCLSVFELVQAFC
jgi:hypothetical protein